MSKATKILDLDKFGGDAERSITVKGVTYPVIEMEFENFVATTKQAQRLQSDPDATAVDHLEASVAMIQRCVPSIPADVLRGLPLTKLGVITQFLNGELDAEMDKAAEEAAEQGSEAAKK